MSGPVQKALARLRDGLAGGNAYEAQQTVKTAYYRLKARRQLQDSYELLQQAAGVQFRAGQFTCGLELAKLLVEAYKADEVPATDDAVERLQSVLDSLPAAPKGDAASQAAMIDATVAWADSAIAWVTRSGGGGSKPLQGLHITTADWLYAQRGAAALGQVSRHYAAGLCAEGIRSVLCDGFDPTKAREWDFYVCRAVLLVLAAAPASPPQPSAAANGSGAAASPMAAQDAAILQLQHYKCALDVLERCAPDTSQPEYAGVAGFPLISMCSHLLEVIGLKKSAALVAALRKHYQPALQRDPELGQLLDAVEETYFRVRRGGSGNGMGGMMGSLMQMLAGGGSSGSPLAA